MERLGVSAVIIEDKKGLKKNSLFGKSVVQEQEKTSEFCRKIRAGINSRISDDFLIIARIESLILEKGMKDALNRAKAYTRAGVDAIMIHSKKKNPKEIFQFSKEFRKFDVNLPLISVPTTYNSVYEKDLIKNKFNMVIYANHMLRAAYPAMVKAAKMILKNERSLEADKILMNIKDILKLIPGTN